MKGFYFVFLKPVNKVHVFDIKLKLLIIAVDCLLLWNERTLVNVQTRCWKPGMYFSMFF